MQDSDSIEAAKIAVRRSALARRDAIPPAARATAGETIAARAFPLPVAPGTTVSGFIPHLSEIDVRPLLRVLAEKGARLALPVVMGRGEPLVMRAWTFGAPLKAGGWGLSEPPADAPEVLPDIVLVPLLAFDRAGNRIGYGAGYYDMTINRLRSRKPVVAVGIAYAAQEIARVPFTPRDAVLDLVLTERETIDFRGT
jgi:5-formyltetrahydrofolate cyclo-ligase